MEKCILSVTAWKSYKPVIAAEKKYFFKLIKLSPGMPVVRVAVSYADASILHSDEVHRVAEPVAVGKVELDRVGPRLATTSPHVDLSPG